MKMEPPKQEDCENGLKKCGICGDMHFYRECKYVTITTQVFDKQIPTRARLSLPEVLVIKKLADETHSVFTRNIIELGTEFGPLVAQKNLTFNPLANFPLKIFYENESDLSEYYLDTIDENECSWMMFVKPADYVEEQNLICYQEGDNLYYGAIRDIKPGEELKVWYSPYYAFKMQKNTLSFKESSKLQLGTETSKKDATELNAIIKTQQNIVPRVVWNCKFCYQLEKNVTDFARHLSTHYEHPKLKKRTCQHCQYTFKCMETFRKHMKMFHEVIMDGKAKKTETTSPKSTENSLKSFQIEHRTPVGGPLLLQCFNDNTENSNSLIQQPEVSYFEMANLESQNLLLDGEHLGINVDLMDTHPMGDLDSEIRSKEVENKEFTCDICLKKFASSQAILVHLKYHMGRYFCDTCKKVFSRAENLKNHKCTQFYSVKCPKCSKCFYQKKYLTLHMAVFHEKKFNCPDCKRHFFSAQELKKHACSKPATFKKTFKCPKCYKLFLTEDKLKQHDQISHVIEKSSKTHICPYCSKLFTRNSVYKRHVQSVHSFREFQCRICDKTFSRSDALKAHMMSIHFSEDSKVSKCSICKKDFKNRQYLNRHIKSKHNSESVHKCACGATFKYQHNLTRHFKQCDGNPQNSQLLNKEECSLCHVKVKLKRSLQRHIRQKHPEKYREICAQFNALKNKSVFRCAVCGQELKSQVCLNRHVSKKHPNPKKETKPLEDDFDNLIDTDQKCIDLRKTIETMDFNIDSCNDNLLGGSDTIDRFLKESSEQMSIFFAESPRPAHNDVSASGNVEKVRNREVFLSMPDLSDVEQDTDVGKSAHISNIGTPLDSTDLVLYINDVVYINQENDKE